MMKQKEFFLFIKKYIKYPNSGCILCFTLTIILTNVSSIPWLADTFKHKDTLVSCTGYPGK